MTGTEELGCCGAYCKTCREFQKTCKGCKLGYWDGSQDLSRVKCKIKKCCLTKEHYTCADCKEYDGCEMIQAFIQHPAYKYATSISRHWSSSATMIMPPFCRWLKAGKTLTENTPNRGALSKNDAY